MEGAVTRIEKRKSRLTVQSSDCVRERGKLREVILDFSPSGYTISVRLKGMKSSFEITPASIYNLAVAKAVEKARAEKKARKRNGHD